MLSWWAVSVFLPPSLPQAVLIKAFNMGESTLGDWWGDTVQGVSNTCWARTCISELPKSLGILFGRQPTNDLISSWPPLAAGPGAQCLLLATSGSRARCTMSLPGHLWQQGQVHNVSSWPPLAAGPGAQWVWDGAGMPGPVMWEHCVSSWHRWWEPPKRKERKKERKKEEQYGNVDVFHPIWMVS